MSAEESTEDDTINLHLDISDIICPICKEVFVFPRTYDCGHIVCELCMYEMDRRDESGDTHISIIHSCPICRKATLKRWYNRPVSHLIERIASVHPDYKRRREEIIIMKKARVDRQIYIPNNIDIALLSHESRIKLSLEIYDNILERLYIAANQGKNHIIINNMSIVSDIEKVGDILSMQLFNNHNIYRLIVTRSECTIYFTKNAFNWRRSFDNTEWRDPLEDLLPPQDSVLLTTNYQQSEDN
uniref:RING-type domain-containing protein n=1 Tax=viral metagenome TaxID=1070528 RepID=A0A6C0LZJ7_9ZZZZ